MNWWGIDGKYSGFASKSPVSPLPIQAPFPHDITAGVWCWRVQETLVVTRVGKKKGVRGTVEIMALVENSWKVACGVFCCVFCMCF